MKTTLKPYLDWTQLAANVAKALAAIFAIVTLFQVRDTLHLNKENLSLQRGTLSEQRRTASGGITARGPDVRRCPLLGD